MTKMKQPTAISRALPVCLLSLSLLSPCLLSPVALAWARTPAAGVEAPDDSIVMRWSTPGRASPPALATWYEDNAAQLATVEHAWAGLLRRMAGHRPARFDSQCSGLVASLEQLDEPALLPVPDPVVDLYVKRLLRHLHHAARACREQELFNVVYHLEEARSSLTEMRWLLGNRNIGALVKEPS